MWLLKSLILLLQLGYINTQYFKLPTLNNSKFLTIINTPTTEAGEKISKNYFTNSPLSTPEKKKKPQEVYFGSALPTLF